MENVTAETANAIAGVIVVVVGTYTICLAMVRIVYGVKDLLSR